MSTHVKALRPAKTVSGREDSRFWEMVRVL
jgi:hypothetical protein